MHRYPDIDPLEDLNTELERKLGAMVKDKYGTDFYILYKFPQKVATGHQHARVYRQAWVYARVR